MHPPTGDDDVHAFRLAGAEACLRDIGTIGSEDEMSTGRPTLGAVAEALVARPDEVVDELSGVRREIWVPAKVGRDEGERLRLLAAQLHEVIRVKA